MARRNGEEAELIRSPRLYMLGSAAVDLEAMTEAVNGEEAFQPRFEDPREEEKREEERKAHPLRSAFALTGTILAAGMAALVLLTGAALTRLGAENSMLNKELEMVREDSRQLSVAMEESFNRNELAIYAVENLHMRRLSPYDTRTLPDFSRDEIEILDESLGENQTLEAAREYFSILLTSIR